MIGSQFLRRSCSEPSYSFKKYKFSDGCVGYKGVCSKCLLFIGWFKRRHKERILKDGR
jgi:hypothetical protein